jgi:hypothetical protein
VVEAWGRRLDFLLTPGQAPDLAGAEAFLPAITADLVLADRAFDADERGITALQEAGKTMVIPWKKNRQVHRDSDQEL